MFGDKLWDDEKDQPKEFEWRQRHEEHYEEHHEEEWDGRREAYRMFGDKLWDEAKNKGPGQGHKEGCHGKKHGGQGGHGHYGEHHGEHGEQEDREHHGPGFCPVLATVYIIIAAHFVYLYKY